MPDPGTDGRRCRLWRLHRAGGRRGDHHDHRSADCCDLGSYRVPTPNHHYHDRAAPNHHYRAAAAANHYRATANHYRAAAAANYHYRATTTANHH